MMIDEGLQKIANKVFKEYGNPDDPNVESLAHSIVRWGYNTKLEDATKALEIAQKKSMKKSDKRSKNSNLS